MELILQKWVEVGYTKFHFFRAKRSQDLRISENKFERLQKILTEAVEQSGRYDVPEIVFHQKLEIADIAWEKYFFHTDPNIAQKLKDFSFIEKKSNIFVWPEGWFSPEEIEDFLKQKFQSVSLWKNILRTETASISVGFYVSQQKI
jgi:16S rRNA (uracil1498-N3)-methyltransferase